MISMKILTISLLYQQNVEKLQLSISTEQELCRKQLKIVPPFHFLVDFAVHIGIEFLVNFFCNAPSV